MAKRNPDCGPLITLETRRSHREGVSRLARMLKRSKELELRVVKWL